MTEAFFLALKNDGVCHTDAGNPMKSATVSAASRRNVKKQHPTVRNWRSRLVNAPIERGNRMFNGIASVIFPTSNLEVDKAFWQAALGVAPYFDQPFYVGFTVDGCELGLDPNAAEDGLTYPISYWTTSDIHASLTALLAAGALLHRDIKSVGDGVLVVTMKDMSGNIFGLLQRQQETGSSQ